MTNNAHKADGYEATIAAVKEQRDILGTLKVELDSKISTAMSRVNGALYGPISLADYAAYLRRAIDQRGESFASRWSLRETPATHGQARPHNQTEWKKIDSGAVDVLAGAVGAAVSGAELCFYFPEVIHARLLEALHARYGDDWGNSDKPPADARRQLAKEADSDLQALQAQLADVEAKIRSLNRAISD